MPPPRAGAAASSPSSSPDSFITADASPPNPVDITATDITAPDPDVSDKDYCNARRLPSELRQHCQIYLEENLHVLALGVLSRLQCSSTTATPSDEAWTPSWQSAGSSIYCPPPNVLAFLNTLTIHPDLTTRPREDQWTDVPSAALEYLRTILHTIGPINARFQEAFRFREKARRNRGDSPGSDGFNGHYDGKDEPQLWGRYGKHGVWAGQDFFNVVGWALNCSVLYPNRWEYWRQWLEFMLDVIEADLLERTRLDEQEENLRAGGEDDTCDYPRLQNSILAGYIKERNGRTGGLKWMIRVLFADGQDSAASLFQEVWYKEHKGVSRTKALKKRKRKINIEKGDFGNLLDDDSVYSSQNSEPPTPQKRRTYSDLHESPALAASYVESIALRQRLFAHLSYLCHYLPAPPVSLPDLYEGYETQVRALPLSIFVAFIDSTTSALRMDSQISIIQDLLSYYMPSSAVNPSKVDRARYDANGTSPAIIERCFLPYAANTIAAEDNAKVSVLLEELIKLVWTIGTEPFSESLYDAVTKGINARQTKIKRKAPGTRGRRIGHVQDDPDSEARVLLEESSNRLRQLAELIMDEANDEATDVAAEDVVEMEDHLAEVSYMTARSS